MDAQQPRRREARQYGAGSTAPQRVSSQTLLGSRRELVIEHNGREYHLRVTQSGKLILTA
jgi:hemin uptake protein HemP